MSDNATTARRAVAALLLSALPLLGCDSKRAEALPEWTPADHDNQDSPAAGQVDTSKKRPGMPDLEKHGINDVVLATWKQNCVRCHGMIGRGDGPDGRALRPPDLTNPNWQRVAIDSEIQYTIKNGRGQMPSFGHLPDDTIEGLVRLIRMLGPRNDAAPPAATKQAQPGSPTSGAPPENPNTPQPLPIPAPEPATKPEHGTPALPPGHP